MWRSISSVDRLKCDIWRIWLSIIIEDYQSSLCLSYHWRVAHAHLLREKKQIVLLRKDTPNFLALSLSKYDENESYLLYNTFSNVCKIRKVEFRYNELGFNEFIKVDCGVLGDFKFVQNYGDSIAIKSYFCQVRWSVFA